MNIIILIRDRWDASRYENMKDAPCGGSDRPLCVSIVVSPYTHLPVPPPNIGRFFSDGATEDSLPCHRGILSLLLSLSFFSISLSSSFRSPLRNHHHSRRRCVEGNAHAHPQGDTHTRARAHNVNLQARLWKRFFFDQHSFIALFFVFRLARRDKRNQAAYFRPFPRRA